jgi:hypothetical protein
MTKTMPVFMLCFGWKRDALIRYPMCDFREANAVLDQLRIGLCKQGVKPSEGVDLQAPSRQT